MTMAIQTRWVRQGDEAGLILRATDGLEPRATLYAVQDTALAGQSERRLRALAALLCRFHDRLANDPGWITVLGADEPPVRLALADGRDADGRLIPDPAVMRLLHGLGADTPTVYGPWWPVTARRAERLGQLEGLPPDIVVLWVPGGALERPFGWPGEADGQPASGHRLLSATRIGGPEGWWRLMVRRLRGWPVGKRDVALTVMPGPVEAERLVLDPQAEAAGWRIQIREDGPCLRLARWNALSAALPVRLASITGVDDGMLAALNDQRGPGLTAF